MSKEIAARHGELPPGQPSFDDVLRALRLRSILPREVSGFFYHLKQAGNAAVHEDAGTPSEALSALKIARAAAIWFYRTYEGQQTFKPGPFVPPGAPADPTPELMAEITRLKEQVACSDDAEAKARLEAQTVKAEADQLRQDREFWENYAAETEEGLRATAAELQRLQQSASAKPADQLMLLANAGKAAANDLDLDEAATRAVIDGQLRAAGWKVDTVVFRHGNGTRPQPGESIAIAEWPTTCGPVDYALFVNRVCVGVIEAKRALTDVPGRLNQAKRYAREITLESDMVGEGAPWAQGHETYRAPFLFVTNGRPYVKQLETKSGIWFWDARSKAAPRALPAWFSARDLKEKLEQDHTEVEVVGERELGVTGLRPYQ